MRYPVICIPFLPMPGMAIFPFVLIKKAVYKFDNTLIYHEKIHLRQQLEMLFVGFYIFYLVNYLFNLVKYLDHEKAYLNIVFEKEAYQMEGQADYLQQRRFWNWTRFW